MGSAREERAERRAARPRRNQTAPPDDSGAWVDVLSAAQVLGVDRSLVQRWAARGVLEHERRGRRIWLRRAHVEQVAAARSEGRE